MTNAQDKAAAFEAENDTTARMAGAGAGVLAGAQLGTVLLPIPIVGTFTGALVGGLVGTKIGKKIGGVLLDKMGSAERPGPTAHSKNAQVIQELERLAQLRESGVLSEDEFKVLKAKMLGL